MYSQVLQKSKPQVCFFLKKLSSLSSMSQMGLKTSDLDYQAQIGLET